MRSPIFSEKVSDSLTISLCHASMDIKQGYWLYDKTQGMNLAMGADTIEKAYLQALKYYQTKLAQVESDYKILNQKVDSFLSQFSEEEED